MLGHKSADSPNKLNTFYYFFCMPFKQCRKKKKKNSKRSHRRVEAYHDRTTMQERTQIFTYKLFKWKIKHGQARERQSDRQRETGRQDG